VKVFAGGLTPAIQFSCSSVPRTKEARMNVRYRVELSHAERTELRALLSGGKHAARKLKRAQILLAADAGASGEAIAAIVGVGGSTVYRTKRRFVLGNLEAAVSEELRPGADRKLSGKEEALLVATACSNPPEGRARWTLELLADELVRLTTIASPARPCAGTWPRTTSSRGARTCGASRRWTASMSPAWGTYSTSTPNHPIRSVRPEF
jgi:transposase